MAAEAIPADITLKFTPFGRHLQVFDEMRALDDNVHSVAMLCLGLPYLSNESDRDYIVESLEKSRAIIGLLHETCPIVQNMIIEYIKFLRGDQYNKLPQSDPYYEIIDKITFVRRSIDMIAREFANIATIDGNICATIRVFIPNLKALTEESFAIVNIFGNHMITFQEYAIIREITYKSINFTITNVIKALICYNDQYRRSAIFIALMCCTNIAPCMFDILSTPEIYAQRCAESRETRASTNAAEAGRFRKLLVIMESINGLSIASQFFEVMPEFTPDRIRIFIQHAESIV